MFSSSSSEEEEVVERRPRVFRERLEYGEIEGTFDFNERFRLTATKMEAILLADGCQLESNTGRSHAVSAKHQLLTTLHWLGTGVQYHCIGDTQGVSKATVCRAVRRAVMAINFTLLQDTVKWPDENPEGIADDFLDEGGMPHVCGCADGTLIGIDAPRENENAFVDRHGNHSLNVLLVCGPDMSFYYVDANWPGSVHDARVMRNSGLYRRFQQGWRPFPNAIILADSAYGLKNWLIPPITRNPDDHRERRFLRRHKATRRLIESAIGILKEKFPFLNHLRIEPVYACEVVKCCVTLCNLSKQTEEEMDSDEEEEQGEEEDVFDGQADLGEDNAIETGDEESSDEEEEDEELPVEAAQEQLAEERLEALLQYFDY